MTDLRFITRAPITDRNSVMEGYDKAQEGRYRESVRQQAAKKAEQDYAKGQQEYDFAQADNPIRLDAARAGATTAQSNARLATGTETSKITEAGNKARESGYAADTAGATSRVATGTEGSKITEASNKARESGSAADESAIKAEVAKGTKFSTINKAAADAREAGTRADTGAFELGEKKTNAPNVQRKTAADADSAESSAQVKKGTVLSDINKAQSEATKAGAEAKTALSADEEKSFVRILEFFKAGRPDLAQLEAQGHGTSIAPEVLNNAVLMRQHGQLFEMAKGLNVNTPQGRLKTYQDLVAKAQDKLGDPSFNPYEMLSTLPPESVPAQTYGLARPPTTPPSQAAQGLTTTDRRTLATIEGGHKTYSGAVDNAAVAAHLRTLGPQMEKFIPLYDQAYRSPQGTPYHPGTVPFAQPQGQQPRPAAPVSQAAPQQSAPPVQPQPQPAPQPAAQPSPQPVPSPAAAQPATAPQPHAAPMPGQRTPNTVYMTPKGPLMWTGTGWVAPR